MSISTLSINIPIAQLSCNSEFIENIEQSSFNRSIQAHEDLSIAASAPEVDFNKCLLITEASSSQTTFFSYNYNYEINYILGKEKFTLNNQKIDSYAAIEDAQGYFNTIRNNSIINEHIISSNCDKFSWLLLATGGMRDLEDKHGNIKIENFYSNITSIFSQNQHLCIDEFCKDITLIEARTISGKEEASYAWTALSNLNLPIAMLLLTLVGKLDNFPTPHTLSVLNLVKREQLIKLAT
jgi:hypothetical protein